MISQDDISFVPRGFVPNRRPSRKTNFTEAEKDFIRENYLDMTDPEMAEALERPPGSVTNCRKSMGLTKYDRCTWTDQEEKVVWELYPDTLTEEIAEQLPGKSVEQIYRKANSLGITKSEEFREAQQAENGRRLHRQGKAHRFEPGHEPANKGRPIEEWMSPEGIENSKATRFKEGQKPANTLFDGAVTIRHPHKDRGAPPYMWIRISKGEWQPYHRYQYEKHVGPIPDGMIVTFKDGNTLNCTPGNLELISRAENARRNRDWEKAMETMEEEGTHASKHLTDNYVAGLMAGGDRELRDYLVEHRQDLIRAARANYKLQRQINDAESNR